MLSILIDIYGLSIIGRLIDFYLNCGYCLGWYLYNGSWLISVLCVRSGINKSHERARELETIDGLFNEVKIPCFICISNSTQISVQVVGN